MDANAIAACTEALRDLLGPGVVYIESPMSDTPSWWRWQDYDIEKNGDIYQQSDDPDTLLRADTLDKLHAASQIVRRFAGGSV